MGYKVEVLQGGRITLPASLRKSYNIQVGDSLLIIEENGYWLIKTVDEIIEEARELFKKNATDSSISLTDELINLRRAEVNQDFNDINK